MNLQTFIETFQFRVWSILIVYIPKRQCLKVLYHKNQGLRAIERHFDSVMTRIIDCRFEFESVVETENTAFLE